VKGYLEDEVIPFDRAATEVAGRIAGEPKRIGLADPIIAVPTVTHGLQRVSSKSAHVQRIPTVGHPLAPVNWRIP
jgi:predicted nucleic acid-binding protein